MERMKRKKRVWAIRVFDGVDPWFTYVTRRTADHRIVASDTRKGARKMLRKFKRAYGKKYPGVKYSIVPFVQG